MNCILIMPTYNEQDCIEQVVATWHSQLSETVGGPFRLIAVNDGSKDKTGQILDALALKMPALTVVHQQNGGHGVALLTGYRKALEFNPEYIFQTDSDDQFDAKDFSKLWKSRNSSFFILGQRKIRHDALHRLVITKILRLLLLILFQVSIDDANVPFRLIRGSYLKLLLSHLPQGIFAPNIFLSVLAARGGQDLMSIPVLHRDRQTGQVSIVRMKLLKICFRSVRELVGFRLNLSKAVSDIRHGSSSQRVSAIN